MKLFVIATALGLLISLALFWLMQAMISNDQHVLKETSNLQMTEFIRLKRETKLKTKHREVPDKPPPPKKRPPPPTMQMQQTNIRQAVTPQMDMPKLDIPLQTSRFSGSLLSGVKMGVVNNNVVQHKISTNLMPLVRIPPRYPMRAANRRIEGWVKIEFTITKHGTVKDAVVVESKPSKIFNRAALQAIKRWKFKPKVVSGEAFEQRAVQILQFKLKK